MLGVTPLSFLSLSFFPGSFFPRLYSLNEAHPLGAATQLFSASDGSVGVTLFFLTFSIPPLLPPSQHLHASVHPSIRPFVCPSRTLLSSWCCQPDPDALSRSLMRHLAGPPPPPC